jgi:hypothetical protein
MPAKVKRKIFSQAQEFTFVLTLAMVNSAGQNGTSYDVPCKNLISVNVGVVLCQLM